MRHASIRRHLKDKHAREYKMDDVPYRLVSDGDLYAGPLHKKQKLNNHMELPLSARPVRSDQQLQLVSVEPISFAIPPLIAEATVSPQPSIPDAHISTVPRWNKSLCLHHLFSNQFPRSRHTSSNTTSYQIETAVDTNPGKDGFLNQILQGMRSLLSNQLVAGFESLWAASG